MKKRKRKRLEKEAKKKGYGSRLIFGNDVLTFSYFVAKLKTLPKTSVRVENYGPSWDRVVVTIHNSGGGKWCSQLEQKE